MTSSRTTVTSVKPLAGRWIRVSFADGAVHEVDLTGLLELGGVFAAIRDDEQQFQAVSADREFGTIVWPGEVDLDPDVVRADQEPATSRPMARRVIQPA